MRSVEVKQAFATLRNYAATMRNRESSLVATKVDEAEMWLRRAEAAYRSASEKVVAFNLRQNDGDD